MTKPELSIIIVHHQTPELLKLCLKPLCPVRSNPASLQKGQGAAILLTEQTSNGVKRGGTGIHGIDQEIIVVDSTISRRARDLIRENYPEVKYLPYQENLGYSRGVNIGIQNSQGDYILILNPDVIITEDALDKMLEYMKKHPDIGMLGPKMLNFNGTAQRSYFSFYKPITIIARRLWLGKFKPFKKALYDFLMADSDPDKIQTPDWLMGSAIMVNKQAIKKVGGMDERFFMYFEDVDWARRFWHNDYKVVYYPEAVVYHYHQRESKSRLGLFDALFNKKTRWHIASAVKFFWKYRNLAKANQLD
jgi:hypothetical protein